jgi:hypothetical protein
MGKAEETYLAEEFVVVGEYALDQLESNGLVEVLELKELRTHFVTQRQRSSKMAGASCAAGPRTCVVLSGRVVGSSSLASSMRRSSSTTLSTNWRGVAAAVDDTTADLDSCSLKHRRRAYFTAYARRSIRQGREEGA